MINNSENINTSHYLQMLTIINSIKFMFNSIMARRLARILMNIDWPTSKQGALISGKESFISAVVPKTNHKGMLLNFIIISP